MFVEAHSSSTENGIQLAFVRSKNIKVFPSGRRRSTLIQEQNNSSEGQSTANTNGHYIPYDPEARLNTENNNRRINGLNGFTNSYLRTWSDIEISIVIDGYSFTITPDEEITKNNFVASLENKINYFIDKENAKDDNTDGNNSDHINLEDDGIKAIYANILLEDANLFSNGTLNYTTPMLRNQSINYAKDNSALDCLDLINVDEYNREGFAEDTNVYYFSGLSFSVEPLTRDTSGRTVTELSWASSPKQRIVSLKVLDKVTTTNDDGELVYDWQIHQPALLPKIEHGETEDSVVIKELKMTGDLKRPYTTVDSDGNTVVKTGKVPTISIVQKEDKYQLQLFNANTD